MYTYIKNFQFKGTHVPQDACRDQRAIFRNQFFIFNVGSRDQTWVISFAQQASTFTCLAIFLGLS